MTLVVGLLGVTAMTASAMRVMVPTGGRMLATTGRSRCATIASDRFHRERALSAGEGR